MSWLVGQSWSCDVAVSRELSRAYAQVCGDDNPIHLDDTAAQARGLPAAVAHGMALQGAALAVVGTRRVTETACRFVAPVVLPEEGERALSVVATVLAPDLVRAEVLDGESVVMKIEIRCEPEEAS